MARPTIYTLALTFLLAAHTHAADDEVAARRAQSAQYERDVARQIRDGDIGLAGDYFRLGAFITEDVQRLKEASEAHASLHDQCAIAFEKGDEAEVKRLRGMEEKANRDRATSRERITEWRAKQFAAAPTEQWFQEYGRWSRAGIPELMAWAEARKAAAEAWGNVADACAPGADPAALEAMKDRAFSLDVDREIAEMRFNWAREREQVLRSDSRVIPTAELTRSIEAMQKLQDARVALKRQEREHEHDVRRLDRSMRAADVDFRKAWEAAQREANERARNPKR